MFSIRSTYIYTHTHTYSFEVEGWKLNYKYQNEILNKLQRSLMWKKNSQVTKLPLKKRTKMKKEKEETVG